MSHSALNLGNATVRQLDGLYSLNDLHKAAGEDKAKQPSNFMRLDQTTALIAEINSSDLQSFKTTTGRNGGTYVCRELVIAYAAWISAAFHLKVIRVFLNTVAPALLEPALISRAQLGELSQRMADRFPNGKDRPYAWSRFNNHFRLASYKDLPAGQFAEACAYIDQMPVKAPALPAAVDAENSPKRELTDEALIAAAMQQLADREFTVRFGQSDYFGGLVPFILPVAPGAKHLLPSEVVDEVATNRHQFFSEEQIKDLLWALSCRLNPSRLTTPSMSFKEAA